MSRGRRCCCCNDVLVTGSTARVRFPYSDGSSWQQNFTRTVFSKSGDISFDARNKYLFVTQGNKAIWRFQNDDTTSPTNIVPASSGTLNQVATDWRHSLVFASDASGHIYSAPYAGGALSTILTASFPSGITVPTGYSDDGFSLRLLRYEPSTDKLVYVLQYFRAAPFGAGSIGTDMIRRCNRDGTGDELVKDLSFINTGGSTWIGHFINSIAPIGSLGKMAWMEDGTTVRTAATNGAGEATIYAVVTTSVGGIQFMGISNRDQFIYFSEQKVSAGFSRVKRMKFDGSGIATLIDHGNDLTGKLLNTQGLTRWELGCGLETTGPTTKA